jgi:hypothetical protein
VKKVYQNREAGNIFLTYREMMQEAAELYDIGDPTNPLDWSEYYDEIIITD